MLVIEMKRYVRTMSCYLYDIIDE